jgi:hypothetical protein
MACLLALFMVRHAAFNRMRCLTLQLPGIGTSSASVAGCLNPWTTVLTKLVEQLVKTFPLYGTGIFITTFTGAKLNIGPLFLITNKTDSLALVREWTMPTERPPLVGEVSGSFFAYIEVSRIERAGHLHLYSRLSRPEPLLFLSSSSSVVLTRLSGPRSRSTASQKIW